MKTLLYPVLLALMTMLFAACSSLDPAAIPTQIILTPSKPTVSLDWKLEPSEVLAYKTAMTQVDNQDVKTTFDFGQLLQDEGSKESLDELLSFTIPSSFTYISLLEANEQNNITVRMVLDKFHYADSSSSKETRVNKVFSELMKSMQGTEQLRGEITPDGAISSFYLASQQKNLLAIFFQLPITPVQVGDHWSLDFNCISMGPGYVPDNAVRLNRVTLSSLSKTEDGKSIAILNYVLAEKVEGNLVAPMRDATPMPASMNCAFFGRGEFLMEEGRWHKFTGKFALSSTGFVSSSSVQEFALLPIGDTADTTSSPK